MVVWAFQTSKLCIVNLNFDVFLSFVYRMILGSESCNNGSTKIHVVAVADGTPQRTLKWTD